MSTIPDLNTDEVSFLGYYQLKDSEIDGDFKPTELNFPTATNGRYDTPSSETYDNGYKLTIKDNKINSTITLRAGNTGHKWITAHIKDYSNENFGSFTGKGTDLSTYDYTRTESDLSGEYDIMPWNDRNNLYEPDENTLFNVIRKGLYSTDYWTQNNLTLSNTGIYNYSVADESQQTSIFCSKENSDNSFSFTDVTTIHRAYIVGKSWGSYRRNDHTLYINDSKGVSLPSNDGRNYSFALNIKEILKNNKQLSVKMSGSNVISSYYCIIVWS
jgi:hypothetical protein